MLFWVSYLYACILYVCICTCSVQLTCFTQRYSRNIINIITVIILHWSLYGVLLWNKSIKQETNNKQQQQKRCKEHCATTTLFFLSNDAHKLKILLYHKSYYVQISLCLNILVCNGQSAPHYECTALYQQAVCTPLWIHSTVPIGSLYPTMNTQHCTNRHCTNRQFVPHYEHTALYQ